MKAYRIARRQRPDAVATRYVGVVPQGQYQPQDGGPLRYYGWQARVRHRGVLHRKSGFRCDTAAALARDRLVRVLKGADAAFNFPELFGGEQLRLPSLRVCEDLVPILMRDQSLAHDACQGARVELTRASTSARRAECVAGMEIAGHLLSQCVRLLAEIRRATYDYQTVDRIPVNT